MKKFLDLIGAEHVPAGHLEKVVAAVGGFTALLLVAGFNTAWTGSIESALLLTSMGASAVLLFAVPHGALSQPWPLLGGHLLSATVGIACGMLIADLAIAGPVAVGLAIAAMYYLRCMHPPGGATALAAVVAAGGAQAAGFGFVLNPVLSNVAILLSVAVLFNLPFRWRRYPVSLSRANAANTPNTLAEVSEADIEYALDHSESFVDITREDLTQLYRLAAEHARHEHAPPGRLRCVDRGTCPESLADQLGAGNAGGPVLFQVVSLRGPEGKDVLVWSKYAAGDDADKPASRPAADS